MLQELKKLALSCDAMGVDDAKSILHTVIKKLFDLSGSGPHTHIIDVYWKEEALDGAILRPFVSIEKDSKRGAAKPYQVLDDAPNPGIWTWVYKHAKPILIEDIKSLSGEKPADNRMTNDAIDARYLRFSEDSATILAVPLIFRGEVWGVLSLEAKKAGVFTQEIQDFLESLSRPMADLLGKADVRKLNEKHTHEAIRLFGESIEKYPPQEIISPVRSGFIARPFNADFKVVEDVLRTVLEKNHIQARGYQHPPGGGIVVEGIMTQIRNSHFGIADITRCNPNVMLELGMMMIVHQDPKKIVLLRAEQDNTECPFDLQPYNQYVYKLEENMMSFFNPKDNTSEPADNAIQAFVENVLSNDPCFAVARPWSP